MKINHAVAVAFLATSLSLIGIAASPTDKTEAVTPPARNLLLVVNQGENSLSLVDPEAGRELTQVKTQGIRGHEVVASSDGLAYVPIYGDSAVGLPGTDGRSIEVVDLVRQEVVSTIDLGRPVRPHSIKFAPDGLLYVTAELDNAVDIVDPRTQKRVASISTQRPQSHMLAISSDGKRAYTSNVDSGTVTVLDLVGRKPLAVVPVAGTVQRISLSVDDKFVFIADQKQPRLAAIDTKENKINKWISLPAIGYGTAPTLDGKWLLVSMPAANQVALVDLAEMKVARTISVAAHPVQILVPPGRSIAYVSCSGGGEVDVIDLVKWEVTKTVKTGPGADGLAWAAMK